MMNKTSVVQIKSASKSIHRLQIKTGSRRSIRRSNSFSATSKSQATNMIAIINVPSRVDTSLAVSLVQVLHRLSFSEALGSHRSHQLPNTLPVVP